MTNRHVIAWMVNSTQFKKWNGIVGGFCLGMWVSGSYWRQIRDTLMVWGVDRDSWMSFLLAIAGASGVLVSVGLSAAKKHNEKTKAEEER